MDPRLRQLFLEIVEELGGSCRLIRIFDPPVKDESGVHRQRPHRAFDLVKRGLTVAEGKYRQGRMNRRWVYDPARPRKRCVLYHSFKGSPFHFHCQIHPNTYRRETAP